MNEEQEKDPESFKKKVYALKVFKWYYNSKITRNSFKIAQIHNFSQYDLEARPQCVSLHWNQRSTF